MIFTTLLTLAGALVSIVTTVAPIALTSIAIAAGAVLMFELLNRDALFETKKSLLDSFNNNTEFKDQLGSIIRQSKTVYVLDSVTGELVAKRVLSDGSIAVDFTLTAGRKRVKYTVAANEVAGDLYMGMKF